jgi:F-type H+-transporting ATPase subunit b
MFAIDIAEKLMKKNLSTDKAQKDLVESYIKDLKIN